MSDYKSIYQCCGQDLAHDKDLYVMDTCVGFIGHCRGKCGSYYKVAHAGLRKKLRVKREKGEVVGYYEGSK